MSHPFPSPRPFPGWRVVVEAIAHPCDPPHIGDLVQHRRTKRYALRTGDSLRPVPDGWAASVDAHERAVGALVERFLAGDGLTLDPATIDPQVGYDAVRRVLGRLTRPHED